MKVERVSYPYPTPSAMRGVLEAICWEPQFRWIITTIEVLRPVRFQGVTRNEVQKKIPTNNVSSWIRDPMSYRPFYANTRGREEGENATQRATLALRDVAYNVTARALVDGANLRPEDTPEKYAAMFERRVATGQCYHRPYLGCREFAADFGPVDPQETPIADSGPVGLMLYDIIYGGESSKRGNEAVFFDARIEHGVIDTNPETVLTDAGTRQRVLQC
jgi:CRISPR-associated protein Cas5d